MHFDAKMAFACMHACINVIDCVHIAIPVFFYVVCLSVLDLTAKSIDAVTYTVIKLF